MTSAEIREKFLEFFSSKGHKIVPSSSLLPKDDPSVLLTTAGMQQFKKYYTEPSLAPAPNIASIQKSFRTSDIDEVGDESHLTFFEMLGNFSFGGYFKKEAIKYAKEFLESIDLSIDYVTVFSGDDKTPVDEESYKIWQSLGLKDIRKSGREDNFWGPTGSEGPCGPTTEIYINGIEIWNIVFNEYYCKNGVFEKLKTPGVDTGMGLERLAMVLQKKKNIFETDLFEPFQIYLISGNVYHGNFGRIISDHLRGSVFLLADGVRPSNKESGYVIRKLLRRIIVQNKRFGFDQKFIETTIENVIKKYEEFYPELKSEKLKILDEFKIEASKFINTLEGGLREFYKLYPDLKAQVEKPGQSYRIHERRRISGKDAFNFYQSFGLTPEIIKDLAKDGGYDFDQVEFEKEFKKHQEISRAGAEKKFGGHGLILNTGELKAGNEKELKIVTRLHTATHLLNAALHKVLGDSIEQRGSDITPERTRFDFKFSRKLTSEEIEKVEVIVNYAVEQDFMVKIDTMPLEEAKKTGALYMENSQYPDPVKVYTVGDNQDTFSKELCGGPHVAHTSEIGKFKIIKEESSSAGIRRIRAIIE